MKTGELPQQQADSATDEFDHDLALTRLSVEQDALYEINVALNRILNRSYGVCEETGRVIPSARLKAIPWTRFTREVEERLEQDGRCGSNSPEQAEQCAQQRRTASTGRRALRARR